MGTIHSDKSYFIGKGVVMLSSISDDGPWEDVGNCSAVSVALALEELEHFSSRAGLKVRDKLVVTSQKASGKFSCDNITIDNLEKYFMADGISSQVQAVGVAKTKNFAAVILDVWYEIGDRKVSGVVVKNEAEIIVYVVDVDYVLKGKDGLIMFLSTGSIAAGSAVHITAYDCAALTTKSIDTMALTKKEYWVKFVGDSATGDMLDIKGKASLKPDGEFSLVSDEWGKLDFAMEFITNPIVTRKGNTEE